MWFTRANEILIRLPDYTFSEAMETTKLLFELQDDTKMLFIFVTESNSREMITSSSVRYRCFSEDKLIDKPLLTYYIDNYERYLKIIKDEVNSSI